MKQSLKQGISLQDLIYNGVHIGHEKSKVNTEATPYLLGVRSNMHIINLETTIVALRKTMKFINDLSANGGTVLFVSTVNDYSSIIESAAKRSNQPYVNRQWVGGLLTNFVQIRKRLNSITDCSYKFIMSTQGVKNMDRLPDALFVIGARNCPTALHEASVLKIPTIAIIDSNDSIRNITYPIPGNDDSILAVNLYCQLISNAILSGSHDHRYQN
uniref:Ribosomal protein S2 n=1 Tax=Histiona aroides TaxID=392300 RepID=M4QKV4_HISAR|nr:ribosomal protein S2 [Histiona aroides]AGH24093.1 ribosomal protein S2 [Histiona aroides]